MGAKVQGAAAEWYDVRSATFYSDLSLHPFRDNTIVQNIEI